MHLKSNNSSLLRLKRATVELSTVRLPFRHSGGIYETALFTESDSEVLERYETACEAIEGHRRYKRQYGLKEI